MKIKEIENKLHDLELEITKLKKYGTTYKDIEVGQSFKYKDLIFTKLNEEPLSIVDTYKDCMDCVFDCYDNNYEKSLIRFFINNRLCELLEIDKEALLPVNTWGDKLTLLSKEEFERHKVHIHNFNAWYWLRSPYSDDANGAWCVYIDGIFYDGYVSVDYGARPVLIFKPDTVVELI